MESLILYHSSHYQTLPVLCLFVRGHGCKGRSDRFSAFKAPLPRAGPQVAAPLLTPQTFLTNCPPFVALLLKAFAIAFTVS